MLSGKSSDSDDDLLFLLLFSSMFYLVLPLPPEIQPSSALPTRSVVWCNTLHLRVSGGEPPPPNPPNTVIDVHPVWESTLPPRLPNSAVFDARCPPPSPSPPFFFRFFLSNTPLSRVCYRASLPQSPLSPESRTAMRPGCTRCSSSRASRNRR